MSVRLFHGPGAREAALKNASDVGVLLAPPYGDSGLKVDEAREIANHLMSAHIGDHIGVVVVGPLDNAASIKALDALLKSIEEVPSPYVIPVLWADDLGGVPPTIVSRCIEVWAGGCLETSNEYESVARRLLDCVKSNRLYEVPGLLSDVKKSGELLNALSDELAKDLENPSCIYLWERVRKVARWRNPTVIEILSALI